MKTSNSLFDSLRSGFAAVVIPLELALAYVIYFFVLGNPANFQGGDPANHPIEGNFLGLIYKGGYLVVPVLIALLMLVLTFAFERLLTISRAKGRGNLGRFVQKIRHLVSSGHIEDALIECDKQRGSVANVMKAGLRRYKEMINVTELDTEQKVIAIQKEVEEATALELPMLQKNLVFLSTITSVGTLIALLGTVIGMIRSFSALGEEGGGNAGALAVGISEALYNTALGIGTSALALIMYNVFTTKIDSITYGIDESGFTLTQSFASLYK